MTARTRAHLLLLLTAAIWGFAFVAQVSGNTVGAFTFNAARFALGAASLLPLLAWLDRRSQVTDAAGRWRAALAPGLLCGGLLFGGASLQQVGLYETTAGNASFVTGLYVVLVPLLGLCFGRRPAARIWVAAALAVIGLYLLTLGGGVAAAHPGDLLCLLGTGFWACHIVAVGTFSRRLDVVRLSVVQFAANALYSAVAAAVIEPGAWRGLPSIAGAVAYAGLGSVGVAYTLQVVAQRDALESHAALLMSLETVFGALGGALLLGERLAPVALAGAVLMLVGIVVSQWEPRRRPTPVVPEPPSAGVETL